jgi:hypothetical protein
MAGHRSRTGTPGGTSVLQACLRQGWDTALGSGAEETDAPAHKRAAGRARHLHVQLKFHFGEHAKPSSIGTVGQGGCRFARASLGLGEHSTRGRGGLLDAIVPGAFLALPPSPLIDGCLDR